MNFSVLTLNDHMKGSRTNNTRQNKTEPVSHRPVPQNKDNLDSRANEEQDTKGDDITHNEKETKREHLKKAD
jgi:hypothetical protein